MNNLLSIGTDTTPSAEQALTAGSSTLLLLIGTDGEIPVGAKVAIQVKDSNNEWPAVDALYPTRTTRVLYAPADGDIAYRVTRLPNSAACGVDKSA
jgi:hypothetical protein